MYCKQLFQTVCRFLVLPLSNVGRSHSRGFLLCSETKAGFGSRNWLRNGDIDDTGIHVTEGHAQVPLDALQIAYEKPITKKRKARDEDKYREYSNCDFILGSGVEIEFAGRLSRKRLE
jgi:hypothetical protein